MLRADFRTPASSIQVGCPFDIDRGEVTMDQVRTLGGVRRGDRKASVWTAEALPRPFESGRGPVRHRDQGNQVAATSRLRTWRSS